VTLLGTGGRMGTFTRRADSLEGVKLYLQNFRTDFADTLTIRVAQDVGAGNIEVVGLEGTQRVLLTVEGEGAGTMVAIAISQTFLAVNAILNSTSYRQIRDAVDTNIGSVTIQVVDGVITEVSFTGGGTIRA
jgi:microcompartment protein CcmK/EutM